MRCVRHVSLLLGLLSCFVAPASATPRSIDFPCFKNLGDGRVLVDGTLWDARMRKLGYRLTEGEYVPYEVLRFTRQTVHDEIWADGMCRMKLLPVAK